MSTPLRTSAAILLAALLLAPAGCGFGSTGPGETQSITELPRQLSTSESRLIRAGNGFGFDLLGRVLEEEGAGNVFLSPLSASMALGMAMNGADGETWSQMRETLRFGDLPQDEINAAYASLMELLTGLDPRVETAVGNSVWLREGFTVRPAFRDDVEAFFDARVETLDFSRASAAETMNAWVRDATGGRIDDIVPPSIDPLTVAFLINAVYFRGTWTTQFDPDDTRDAAFRRPDGSTVQVPTMEARNVRALYHRTSTYEALDLPYGGEAFAMTVVLPPVEADVSSFAAEMDAEAWGELVDGLAERELTVALPRFGLTYERLLNDDLRALGMTDAFDGARADFSRMAEDARRMGLHVENVKQKTFLEVDEEGTEAAGATSVEVGATSAPPTFRADRPFLFAIRERLTGTILFLGVLTDPTAG